MNRFDTLKIEFHEDHLEFAPQQMERFSRTEKTDRTTGVTKTFDVLIRDEVKEVLGLVSLELEHTGKTTLEFSAKTLGTDYADGITANNIERAVLSALPKWVRCPDVGFLLSEATVRRADVTENIPTRVGVERTLTELAKWEQNVRYRTQTEGRGRVGTVYWRPRFVKRKTHELKAYDKLTEMTRSKQRGYATVLQPERFRDKVRVEYVMTAFQDMRDAFGLGKGAVTRLSSVLESKEPVLANAYDRILTTNQKEQQTMTERTLKDCKDRLFYRALFVETDWEWRIAEHQLRSYYSRTSNPYREIKKARRWYDTLKGEQGLVVSSEVERLRSYLHSL